MNFKILGVATRLTLVPIFSGPTGFELHYNLASRCGWWVWTLTVTPPLCSPLLHLLAPHGRMQSSKVALFITPRMSWNSQAAFRPMQASRSAHYLQSRSHTFFCKSQTRHSAEPQRSEQPLPGSAWAVRHLSALRSSLSRFDCTFRWSCIVTLTLIRAFDLLLMRTGNTLIVYGGSAACHWYRRYRNTTAPPSHCHTDFYFYDSFCFSYPTCVISWSIQE